jgi:hypothetical protein
MKKKKLKKKLHDEIVHRMDLERQINERDAVIKQQNETIKCYHERNRQLRDQLKKFVINNSFVRTDSDPQYGIYVSRDGG